MSMTENFASVQPGMKEKVPPKAKEGLRHGNCPNSRLKHMGSGWYSIGKAFGKASSARPFTCCSTTYIGEYIYVGKYWNTRLYRRIISFSLFPYPFSKACWANTEKCYPSEPDTRLGPALGIETSGRPEGYHPEGGPPRTLKTGICRI